MATLKRYDVKKLLANPDLRRRLIIESTRVTQAREDIEVARDQVENSYYVVTEAEQAAFFGLVAFRTEVGDADGRHAEFVRALGDRGSVARINVALRDFANIDGAPLAYSKVATIGFVFRENPPFEPAVGVARQGKSTSDYGRWIKRFWEVTGEKWVVYVKSEYFSRYYTDFPLVIDWSENNRPLLKLDGNGLPNQQYYFRSGITWTFRSAKGFVPKYLPPNAVFSQNGMAIIPHKESDIWWSLSVLGSTLAEHLIGVMTSFHAYEAGILKRFPICRGSAENQTYLAGLSQKLHCLKGTWDTGNEVCTRFDRPWLLQPTVRGGTTALAPALDAVLSRETALDGDLTTIYQQLNDAVYRAYGVNDALRTRIEVAIGDRPPEVVWPQMEGKTAEQKRMEHVCRLLTYAVKCVLEQDDDGVVALQRVAQEPPLLERVRAKLASFFPQQDQHTLEIELVNELKKRVKGYARAESLHDWLTDVFFDFHCALYQQRPILWHLASSQESAEPAFSAIVHYHRFDHDRLAKLRSVHVRDRVATLRREAAQAGKDGREDDRLQLLAAFEEVEAFDRTLARLQEGHHEGGEAGENDYRILTPWKAPQDRPRGWRPDLDDGVKVNIAPLARTGLLRTKNKFGAKEPED